MRNGCYTTLIAIAILVAVPAHAGLVTGEFAISDAAGGSPDVCYDSVNQRYLVVWSSGSAIWGRFVSDSGAVGGALLQISDAGYYAQFPQLAYNSTNRGFLVTWDADDRPGGRIYGQLIDAATGTRKFATDFNIGIKPGGWRSNCAWSSRDNVYLVVYYDAVDVWGQLVYGGGGLKGTNFDISQTPVFAGYPAVCYGRSGDVSRFLVTWGDNSGCIYGRRLDAATGAVIDAAPIHITSGGTEDRSATVFDPVESRWLVQHHSRVSGSTDLLGRFVGMDGALVGDPIAIADTTCFEGGTNFGCDIACEPNAGRFFSSFQLECSPPNYILYGQELTRGGSRLGGQVFFVDAGQFTHVAADTYRHRFMVVRDGTRVYGMIFGAAPAPVSAFSAAPANGSNTLSWTNSPDAHSTGTLIVYRTDRYATSPSDGTLVCDRPGAPGSSDTYVHTGLANRTACYYTAFAHDIGPNYAAMATAAATPSERPRTVISSATFPSNAQGWSTTVWRSNPEGTYPYGKMYWQGSLGNPDGCMRSTGDGSSDNTDRCTREGGEIRRGISSAGYKNLLLSYDLRTGPLGAENTGAGAGSCVVDHNLIDEQLTVCYSTDGGSSWSELEWLRRAQLLPVFQNWRTRQIDMSSIVAANNCSTLAVRFRWQLNGASGTGDYADLDNISLSGDVIRVQDALAMPDGAPITLSGKVLFLRQSGFGYIEEQDRTRGIRVETASTATPGRLCTVTGTMRTTLGGERYVQASSLSPGAVYSARPLGVTNRDLLNPLANGLYVTTWGVVTEVDAASGYYVITDGSVTAGVKVITSSSPIVSVGQHVTVTGAAGWDAGRIVYPRQAQ